MTTVDVQPAVASVPSPEGRYVSTRLPVRRFTVAEYHRMIADGYFASDERFELLEGWIVAKVSRNPVHDAAVDLAEQLLAAVVPSGWYVRGQKAFTTPDSEPEPDVVIVRGTPRDYAARHPGPSDAALVVEVANSSLAEDRDVKLRIYSGAGVSTYWIVNLIDRTIEVYTGPTTVNGVPAYTNRAVISSTKAVSASVGGTVVGPISVAEFLP